MNEQRGYTLIETLITLVLTIVLSAGGLFGWQRWQQQQRLWQTARQVHDYLLLLRDDANWHNRDRLLSVGHGAGGWCLSASDGAAGCASGGPFTLRPRWPDVTLSHVTPGLGFYGLRNSAWAGHISLHGAGGGCSIIVSHWGRVRLCRSEEAASCL